MNRSAARSASRCSFRTLTWPFFHRDRSIARTASELPTVTASTCIAFQYRAKVRSLQAGNSRRALTRSVFGGRPRFRAIGTEMLARRREEIYR